MIVVYGVKINVCMPGGSFACCGIQEHEAKVASWHASLQERMIALNYKAPRDKRNASLINGKLHVN